ncbi:hypothetical protein BK744_09215 [Bacillus thuringiensis serovar zhaodongensis]|uniref:hypothetical protein n=1 Tax=Bacillus thuringiensis TaxID=1428 RepID=UPI000A38E64E|nr:hypothetical protein [Bacillus thuringiensis]OUB77045.1 hypothetical protein BK744_09215 [Bacillus thuringiensis serovar zhaodongensis]
MREIIIKFSTEGERFRELDESKSYFLQEAEEIIFQLRHKVKSRSQEVQPKRFGLYLNGKFLLDSKVSFSDKNSIEQQIKDTFLRTDVWSDEIKKQYVNILSNYAKEEKQAFLNQEFRSFVFLKRDLFEKKADFLLSLKQSERLFKSVYAKISNGFFSQLEDIVSSMFDSYEYIVHYHDLLNGNYEEVKGKKEEWFGNVENFGDFVRFVTANYFSINRSRLKAIQTNNPLYHSFQDYLFEWRAKTDFQDSLKVHEDINQKLQNKWTEVLLNGSTFVNAESVEKWVIEKVLREFFEEETKREGLSEEEKQFCEIAAGTEIRF